MKNFTSDLGELANPNAYTDALSLPKTPKSDPLESLKMMLTIRKTEEAIAELIEAGHAQCPCHLGIGQEAIAVGIASNLRNSDRLYGTHRAHAQYLATGGSPYSMLAEVLGKQTGCAGGIGGSMHLLAMKNGFYGSVPIVGGTIPLAVGAGFAAKFDGQQDIAICFFGDGATEEGVLHESLNLASTYEVPVLFVCENNLYSSHMDIHLRQPNDSTARFADAHHVKKAVIDGNDLFAVEEQAGVLIDYMRETGNPAYLEAVTYRWRGHVGPNEDIDVGIRRSPDELSAWKQRDPVRRLAEALINDGVLTTESFNALEEEISQSITEDVNKALSDPLPPPSELTNHTYIG